MVTSYVVIASWAEMSTSYVGELGRRQRVLFPQTFPHVYPKRVFSATHPGTGIGTRRCRTIRYASIAVSEIVPRPRPSYSKFVIKWPMNRVTEKLVDYLRSLPDALVERTVEHICGVRCWFVYPAVLSAIQYMNSVNNPPGPATSRMPGWARWRTSRRTSCRRTADHIRRTSCRRTADPLADFITFWGLRAVRFTDAAHTEKMVDMETASVGIAVGGSEGANRVVAVVLEGCVRAMTVLVGTRGLHET